ncbi:MAG: 3-dehydroquinate synthase [Pseudomonadota bacterium]
MPEATSAQGARDEISRVNVALGERSYDIHIGAGLIEKAPGLIAEALGDTRLVIVTDDHVAAAQIPRLQTAFAGTELIRDTVIVPAGEATKRFERLEQVCNRLLASGLERGDAVVALGGGVVGDLAGFAASIVRRGVRFVQIPTSLLAQVDSSVGGKTGINTAHGKNLIGAFHQPALVIADTDALATLSDRQLRAGYAEVVKYGLLGDREFFDWLQINGSALLARDQAAIRQAVRVSCEAKARIVADDERERGQRALLNLGHTFGHALEAWAGYSDRLLHGEAIAIGMVLAFRYSARIGLASTQDADTVEAHFRSAGLPTSIAEIPSNAGPTGRANATPSVSEMLALMGQDKKVERGKLVLVLARAIGYAFTTSQIDIHELETFLTEERTR